MTLKPRIQFLMCIFLFTFIYVFLTISILQQKWSVDRTKKKLIPFTVKTNNRNDSQLFHSGSAEKFPSTLNISKDAITKHGDSVIVQFPNNKDKQVYVTNHLMF